MALRFLPAKFKFKNKRLKNCVFSPARARIGWRIGWNLCLSAATCISEQAWTLLILVIIQWMAISGTETRGLKYDIRWYNLGVYPLPGPSRPHWFSDPIGPIAEKTLLEGHLRVMGARFPVHQFLHIQMTSVRPDVSMAPIDVGKTWWKNQVISINDWKWMMNGGFPHWLRKPPYGDLILDSNANLIGEIIGIWWDITNHRIHGPFKIPWGLRCFGHKWRKKHGEPLAPQVGWGRYAAMLLCFYIHYWLVVCLPLWKIWVRQLGWLNSQYIET